MGKAGPSQGSSSNEAAEATLTLPLAQTPYVKVTTLTGVCRRKRKEGAEPVAVEFLAEEHGLC